MARSSICSLSIALPARHRRRRPRRGVSESIREFDTKNQATHSDCTSLSLKLGVGNFSVIADQRVPLGAARVGISPADTAGEVGVGVREEELEKLACIELLV
jgi:hypothetical protein